MKQYHIFHSKPNKFMFTETEIQPREYVGFVNVNSIEEVFKLSQNIESDWNPTNPCRSTSVGDVIQENDKFFMVCSVGFKELRTEEEKPKGWLSIEEYLPMWLACDFRKGYSSYMVKDDKGNEFESTVSDHVVWYYMAKEAGITHWFNN